MKKFSTRLLVLICVLCVVSCFESYAQRQTAGRSSIEAYGSLIGGYGGGAAWSNYGFNGRTYFGLDIFNRNLGFYTDEILDKDGGLVEPRMDYSIPSWEALFTMGYMWRLVANRSRSVILSAGGGIGAGVRYCPGLGDFEWGDGNGNYTSYGTVGFLFVISPDIQIEVFPASNLSAFLSLRPKVCPWDTLGKGYVGWFAPQASVGLKYYL